MASTFPLWLTVLAFDDASSTMPGVVPAGRSRPSGWAGALVLRWSRVDDRPRCDVVSADGDARSLLELVVAEAFDAPLLDAAAQQATFDTPSALQAFGIDFTFTNRLRDAVVPQTWALLVLATPEHVDSFLERVGEAGRAAARIETVLSTSPTGAGAQSGRAGHSVTTPRGSGHWVDAPRRSG
jgi:hypothetical protein